MKNDITKRGGEHGQGGEEKAVEIHEKSMGQTRLSRVVSGGRW